MSKIEDKSSAMSAILPPPPIFKPTIIQMQRSGSIISKANTKALEKSQRTENGSMKRYNGVKSPIITTLNSNYLTSSFVSNEDYNNKLIRHSPSISPMTYYTDPPQGGSTGKMLNGSSTVRPRKRRRSSQISSREELEQKRRELRTQHSIIEKKRRIKMNREFEALKFMVPACRVSILNGLNENSFETSNMMHKLTILQSTVEYIKYLHLVIQLLKLQMLTPKPTRVFFKEWFRRNDNLKFVNFDLDLQKYRNIEKKFDFEEMFMKVWKNDGQAPAKRKDPIAQEIAQLLTSDNEQDNNDTKTQQQQNQTQRQHQRHQSSTSIVNEQISPRSKRLTPPYHNSKYHVNIENVEETNTPLTSSLRKKSVLIDLPPPYPSTIYTNRGNAYSDLPSYKLDRFAALNIPNKIDQNPQHIPNTGSVRSLREQSTGSLDSDPNNFKLPLPAIVDQPSFLSSTSSFNSSSQSSASNSPLFWGLPSKFTFSTAPTKLRSTNYSSKIPVTMKKSSSLPSPPPPDIDTASKVLMSIKDGQKRASIPELLN